MTGLLLITSLHHVSQPIGTLNLWTFKKNSTGQDLSIACVCVCVCVCVYVCVYVCVCISVCMCVCTYVCFCIHMCVYMCLFIFMCTCVNAISICDGFVNLQEEYKFAKLKQTTVYKQLTCTLLALLLNL